MMFRSFEAILKSLICLNGCRQRKVFAMCRHLKTAARTVAD